MTAGTDDGVLPGFSSSSPWAWPVISAPTALIAIAEKGYLTLELKVEGAGGHSAAPGDQSTIRILAKAVAKLEAAPFPYRVTPARYANLAARWT